MGVLDFLNLAEKFFVESRKWGPLWAGLHHGISYAQYYAALFYVVLVFGAATVLGLGVGAVQGLRL